jgi:hypothetical protein
MSSVSKGYACISSNRKGSVTRMARPLALLWAGLVAGFGCEAAPSPRAEASDVPWVVFRDTTSVGGSEAEGPAAFGSIRAAALLSGQERFVVADGQTQEIHLFDLAGQHVLRIGGRGAGPGEHRSIEALRGAEDGGLCTWDTQSARVTRFGVGGLVMGSHAARLDGMESIRPSFEGFFGDCSFVLRDQRSTMEMRSVPEGLRRDTVQFVLFGADGQRIRTLADLPADEHWFKNRGEHWGRVQLIFGEQLIGFPQGNEFWFGTSDKTAWTRLSLEGETLGARQFDYAPRTVSDAEVQAERRRRIDEVRVPRVLIPIVPPDFIDRMEESQRDGLRAVPARTTLPAYDAIVPGEGGGFWLREHPLPADSTSIWVFVDSLGEAVGRTVLPRDALILSGSADVILVGATDEWGTPVLRIAKRAP